MSSSAGARSVLGNMTNLSLVSKFKPGPKVYSSETKYSIFSEKDKRGKSRKSEGEGKVGEMSSSAGARSVLGNMTNLRGPDTGLLRPGVKTHVTGG